MTMNSILAKATKQVQVLDPVTHEVIDQGELKYRDNEQVIIEDPKTGIEKVYETTKVIVKLLPLLESIWQFIKRLFTKNDK